MPEGTPVVGKVLTVVTNANNQVVDVRFEEGTTGQVVRNIFGSFFQANAYGPGGSGVGVDPPVNLEADFIIKLIDASPNLTDDQRREFKAALSSRSSINGVYYVRETGEPPAQIARDEGRAMMLKTLYFLDP